MSNASWIEFLQQQGASFSADNHAVQFAADSSTAAQAWLIPLVDQTLLSLTGADAEKFLQGQLSCDVSQLSCGHSLLGSNCTPKGNVISVFRLLKLAEQHLFLRLPKVIQPAAQANLGKYIVFSKAQLLDVSDDYVGLGLQGPGAAKLLAEHLGDAPVEVGDQLIDDRLMVVRVPGLQPRFELWAPLEQARELWIGLAAKADKAGTDHWRLAEIQAGLVQLDADAVDTYLPQMLNLQALEGVSFSKGCYTGQEVITRLQYRGKLKKALFRARVDGGLTPQPGMSLHSPNRSGVGKVLAVAPCPDGGYELQAVIGKSAVDANQLHLDSPEGPSVRLLELPYSLDATLFER